MFKKQNNDPSVSHLSVNGPKEETSSESESSSILPTWLKSLLQDYLFPCLIGFFVAWLVTEYVFCTAYVPSGSMEPTIMTGERMLVAYTYHPERLDRGDIVVFESKEYGKFFVKRLIAKGGDTVHLYEDGSVEVNGERLDEPYVTSEFIYQPEQTFKVPEGQLFFLGDNRMHSHDARYWEQPFISEKDVLGKPFLSIFPLSSIRWLN